jgi:hypothetical protein
MREILLRSIPTTDLSGWKRAGADELLEQLGHFRLARNFSIQKTTHRR